MKANQSSRNERNDQAEVGIGTMIVFIAAVIVAAIAAAVLVNTAGNLQRKSQETGEETTEEVSSNIFVKDAVGHTKTLNGEDRIDDVNITVGLAPGAEPVDLTTMHIRWQDNESLQELQFDQNSAASADGTSQEDCHEFAHGFCVLNVLEEEGSSDQVLEPGDRVHIHVGMNGTSEALETRMDVSIRMIPETGAPTETGFETPASYSGETFIRLR